MKGIYVGGGANGGEGDLPLRPNICCGDGPYGALEDEHGLLRGNRR